MTGTDYRHLVSRLFPPAGGRARPTRVAVEQELLTADAVTGAAVPLDRLRAAVEGASYAPYVTFEPGGQVELSLQPAAGPDSLGVRVRADLAALRADCADAGVVVQARPVDPRPESEV